MKSPPPSPPADPAALTATGPDGMRPALDDFLDRILGLLHRTADAIDAERFVHSLPQRKMVDQ